MRKLIALVAAVFALAVAGVSPATANSQCTTLASQDNANVITVLPFNGGTTTASTNSNGAIACTTG